MSDNELLLALRNEIQPIKDTLQETRNELHDFRLYVENEIEPKIQLLAENYVPAAKRYERASAEMDGMKADIEIIKVVIADHSKKLSVFA